MGLLDRIKGNREKESTSLIEKIKGGGFSTSGAISPSTFDTPDLPQAPEKIEQGPLDPIKSIPNRFIQGPTEEEQQRVRDRIENINIAADKEAQRKKSLAGGEERLAQLLAENKRLQEQPEFDFTREPKLTEDILRTRNQISANQPGFKTGLRESIGLEPTTQFGAQLATPERAEAKQVATEQARQQEGFTSGRILGEVGKQAALYATVGSALKGTEFFRKLSKTFGSGKLATFASDQIADLFIDAVIQTPQEVLRGDTLDTIGMNRLVDIGMNLGIGLIGEYFKSLKNADTKGFDQAIKQLSPEQTKIVTDALNAKSVDVSPLVKGDLPQIQALKGSDVAIQPQVGPVKSIASDTGFPKDLSTTVGKSVDNQLINKIKGVDNATNRTFTDAISEPTTQAAKIDGGDSFKTTIPLDGSKRTQDGLVERGFSQNIRTDEAIAKEINADFDADPLFYEQLTNKTTLERAQARFDVGYEAALKDFELTKGDLRADNVVLAKMLANQAAANGDLNTSRRIITDVAENLTTAGQYSQAARILRESNDPAAIIMYIESELKKLNKQGLKRYGKEKPTLLSGLTGSDKTKGWKNIDLTDADKALIEAMPKQATDAEKQILFEELYKSISDRIPTTKREKLDAWRRVAMLTNPKTHIRNIVGNGIMAAVKKVSDSGAAVMEKLIPQADRTKSLTVSADNRKLAETYWDANKSDLSEGSRWEIFGVKSPFAEKKVFNTKALEAINNFSKNTLEGEDIFFLKRHFTRDLAGFMQARGLKEPTQEAVEYALRRAQEATFRQQNALADIISKGKKSRYGLLVEAAIPFSKTPANIAQMGIDYSPIGVVKAVSELATNQPPAKFIETLSKGLTGTGLSAMGYYMSVNGLARGSYRSDPEEEALFNRMGILPNSIQLPTGSYTIDWAQPAAIPFFMGIAAAEEMKKKNDDTMTEKMLNSGVKGVATIFEQTMLSGISDIFGSYDSEGIVENIAELPLNYLTQVFPTVGGQIARSVDPVKRERDYSTILSSTKSQVQSKIPGLSLELPSKRGIFGEEIKYGEGALNTLQQFVSPGYFAAKQDDPLTNELFRLYNEVGKDFLPRAKVKSLTFRGETYKLTPQERSDFQKVMGEYTENRLKEIINSEGYKSLDDKSKAKVIRNINDRGYDLAKEQYVKKVTK